MDYEPLKQILKDFYAQNGLAEHFYKDNSYLEPAFHEINEIWFRNLEQIKEVKYLMIAEAPLWGEDKNYFYNPATKDTSFFFKSDLETVLNICISDKEEFIARCNEIGLLIIDISPFALNSTDTIINYRTITKKQYRKLVHDTLPYFFEYKLKTILPKKSESIKLFIRYARVKRFFNIISKAFISHQFITVEDEISGIHKGFTMDRAKFVTIIKQ